MKRALFFVLFLSAFAFGQGSVGTGTPVITNPLGQPVPGATVAVCTANPGSPVSGGCPGNLATTFTDITDGTACSGTNQPLNNSGAPLVGAGCSNPGTADGSGNVVAYAAAGQYWCEYYGTSLVGVQVIPCIFPTTAGGGLSPTFNKISAKNIESVRYADQFPGSDIGAQINAAYADLPSTGGEIDIPSASGCYNFTTPIVAETSGKYLLLRGLATSSSTNSNPGGVCLNYTPTTATTAITLDYTPLTGGGYAPNGISNLTLTNNACSTTGGCASSATGISMGTVNGGAAAALFENVKVSGFGTGFAKTNAASQSWGQSFINDSFVWNTTGLALSFNENDSFFETRVAVNGTGISDNGSEFNFHGGSIDSNTTVGVVCTNAVGITDAGFYGTHFENLGVTNTHYLDGTCNYQVFGGQELDDNTTGTADWLFRFQGNNFIFWGMEVQSAGQTVTAVISLAGGNGSVRGLVSAINISGGGGITTIVDPASSSRLSHVTNMSFVAGNANVQTDWAIESNILPSTIGINFLGSTAFPFGGLYLANGAAANSLKLEAATQTANRTATFPDNTGTVAELNLAQAFTAAQTFTNPVINTTSITGTPASGNLTATIATGTAAMTTAGISTGACGSTVTVAATGVLTTDTINVSRNAAATIGNGGGLTLNWWPTAGNVNFNYCNSSAGTITPTGMTVNWAVTR